MAESNEKRHRFELTRTKLAGVILVTVLISSLITWGLITGLTTSKSVYAADINRIYNNIAHMKDSSASLDNFTGYQNSRIDSLTDFTQTHFDEVNNSISDANGRISDANKRIDDSNNKISQTQSDLAGVKAQADNLKTQTDTLTTQYNQLNNTLTTVSQTASDTKSALDTLTSKVNSLAGGLQITPSVSSGSIDLAIQSDIAQTVAFRIDFRPTSDIPEAATMDAALAALYGTPPVTLTAGSVVRGDYTLFWSTTDSHYHLGLISFITMGTSLIAGTNTKTITYSTAGTYEILITPEYPTGTSTGSW